MHTMTDEFGHRRGEGVAAASTDERFMHLALAVARIGADAGEVPIGAVLVRDGHVLARAHNAPVASHDPTAHAEILVLRAAGRAGQNYRLPGTTLYVTAEPCVMCVGALIQARVQRVVFGCPEPRTGALGSAYNVGSDERGNHRLLVARGVCAPEARALLQQFFQVRRGA